MSLLQAGWDGSCPGVWCVGVGLHSEAFWTHTHSPIQGCALAPPGHPLQDPREKQAQLNESSWGQATGWKPCPPPTVRIIPQTRQGRELQGMALGTSHPFPVQRSQWGFWFSNGCFRRRLPPAGNTLSALLLIQAVQRHSDTCMYMYCHAKIVNGEITLWGDRISCKALSLFFCCSVSASGSFKS